MLTLSMLAIAVLCLYIAILHRTLHGKDSTIYLLNCRIDYLTHANYIKNKKIDRLLDDLKVTNKPLSSFGELC